MRLSTLEPGQTYGNLTLIGKLQEQDKHGAYLWECTCVCGNKKIVSSGKVRRGNSCGCVAKENYESKSLVGRRFGRLLILEKLATTNKDRCRQYLCKCDCGNQKAIFSNNLNGGTESCGCLAFKKLPHGEGAFNQLYLTYKICAKRRKLEFNLTKKKFKELTKLNCYYCDDEPKQNFSRNRGYGSYVYNGIDRLDSLKGYIEDNCVACCGKCNKMKMDTNVTDFLNHVAKIYQKQVAGG